MNPIQPSTISANSKTTPTTQGNKPADTPSLPQTSTPQTNTKATASQTGSTSATPSTTRTSNQQTQPSVNNSASLNQLVNTLKTSQAVTAQVTSSQALTQAEQQLLQKANPEAAKQLLKTDLQSQAHSLQQSPNKPASVYLVKLTVTQTNSAAAQPLTTRQQQPAQALSLTTITNTPLKIGTPLQLQLQTTSPQGLPTESSAKQSIPNILIKPSANILQPAIAEGLRLALPQQSSSSPPSSSALLQTTRLILQVSQALKQPLLSNNMTSTLERLNSNAVTATSLNQPQAIKNALANSGLFLESKLQTQQSINNDLRSLLNTLQAAITKETPNLNHHMASAQAAAINVNPQALDTLLQQLLQTLHTSHSKAESQQQSLSGLLQLFGIKAAPDTSSESLSTSLTKHQKLREAIHKHLAQMAQQTQEKIHLNQLKAFVSDTPTEAGGRPNVFNTEISLRWGEQVLPLHVSIQDQTKDHHKEQRENDQKEGTQEQNMQRRWQVFLSFELPKATKKDNKQAHTASIIQTDSLFAQLTIIDDSVSATVWSESPLLCRKAKQQLHILRDSFVANGLQVDELSCINGKPPPQELSLGYNLVDITT